MSSPSLPHASAEPRPVRPQGYDVAPIVEVVEEDFPRAAFSAEDVVRKSREAYEGTENVPEDDVTMDPGRAADLFDRLSDPQAREEVPSARASHPRGDARAPPAQVIKETGGAYLERAGGEPPRWIVRRVVPPSHVAAVGNDPADVRKWLTTHMDEEWVRDSMDAYLRSLGIGSP